MKIQVKKRDNKSAVAAMALGALTACQPFSAHADDTATEIHLLKERLKQLEQRVAEQGRKESRPRKSSAKRRRSLRLLRHRDPRLISILSVSAFRRNQDPAASPEPRPRFAACPPLDPPPFSLKGSPSRPAASWPWKA
jgi:hypothetical protein